MIPDNNWYGHRRILAEYCGLRGGDRPAFAGIMHGWQLALMPGQGNRRLTVAPHLVWNRRHLQQAREAGVENVHAVGGPFTYLCALLDSRVSGPPAGGTGTLVFPFHGSPLKRVFQDREGLIRGVEEREEAPFTVSIFSSDLDRPDVVRPFQEAGWRVVSFGRRDDPAFLFRLYAEILTHRTVLADRVGSGIWYGAYLGRSVRVGGPRPGQQGSAWVGLDESAVLRERDLYPELHCDGLSGKQAREIAAEELGADCMLPASELESLLGWRSTWRRGAAQLVATAMELKFGRAYRAGTDERPGPWRLRKEIAPPNETSRG